MTEVTVARNQEDLVFDTRVRGDCYKVFSIAFFISEGSSLIPFMAPSFSSLFGASSNARGLHFRRNRTV